MFVTSIYRITGLKYTYRCAILSAAYLCKLYLQNHWVTLHLWVSNLKFSLLLLPLPTQSLCFTTLMGVQPLCSLCWLALSTEITVLQYSYGCATFSAENTCQAQYVVLGPRVKVIFLNILPESSCNELKYSLKIAFMFVSIILKFQVPNINILLGICKKATVFDGSWTASQVSSTIKT